MPTRYLLGVLLLLLGLGFLLDQFYPGLHLVSRYWPALLILWGLNDLLRNPRRPVWPLILLVVGILMLARTLAGFAVNPWIVIAAAVLIGLGLRLLIPERERRPIAHGPRGEATMTRSDDRINQSVSFGGAKMRVNSQQFRGGRVSVAFGGVELDLRNANLAPEGAELRLDAVFGGIDVFVPVGWPVEVQGAPALGGCEVHLANTEIAAPNGAALRIYCSGAFGGITIKN